MKRIIDFLVFTMIFWVLVNIGTQPAYSFGISGSGIGASAEASVQWGSNEIKQMRMRALRSSGEGWSYFTVEIPYEGTDIWLSLSPDEQVLNKTFYTDADSYSFYVYAKNSLLPNGERRIGTGLACTEPMGGGMGAIVVCIGFHIEITTSGSPDEIYVNGLAGDDITGQRCNPSKPFRTIQAAINAALSGDTVLVADGIYAGVGNVDLDFGGKDITVRSENGPANCIIDCEGIARGFHFHSGEALDSVVAGFTIRNGSPPGRKGGAIYCDNASPTITNNIITRNYARDGGGGIACEQNSSPAITNNVITGNSVYSTGGGIFCRHNSSPAIINNTITGNGTSYGSGGGIFCEYNSSPTITNNTITGNSSRIHGGGIVCTISSSPTITNSILWNNSPKEIHLFSASITISYSDIQGGWEGEGNRDADPLFVDAVNGDYHLSDFSSCIGAGTSAGAPATDIEGIARGIPPDMGAYENSRGTPLFPIILTSPNGGEAWTGGSSQNITWQTLIPRIDHIRLLYSTDSGNSYPNTIIASTEDDGTYAWTVPMLDSSMVRVKAVAEDSGNTILAEDNSNGDFTIYSNRPPVADANGPYTCGEGSLITFNASGSSDPDGDLLQYRWDFDNDGNWDTEWSSSPTAEHTWDDDWSCEVRLEVSDGTHTDADTASVTVNNVTPIVNAGSNKQVNEGSIFAGSGSFTDPGADTWTATVNYGDGTGDQPLTLTDKTFSLSHAYADNDTYTVTVSVTDDDEASASDTLTVTVVNVAPTVDAGVNQTVTEGSVVSLDSASFNDLGTLDSHTATIDWGDGSPVEAGTVSESPFGPPGSTSGVDGTVAGSHVYADDGIYTVTVTVTDDDLASTADTLLVTVLNVAPTVAAGADQTASEGSVVNLDPASFNDLGTLDSHTATINWGDGTAIEAGVVTEEAPVGPPGSTANGTVAGSHVYGDNGVYTVTVTVIDDDNGIGSDTLQVTVTNVAPTADAGEDQEITAGDYAVFSGSLSDVGWLDTHTATWDFGDGATDSGVVTEENVYPDATGTVAGGHSYFVAGTYTVTLTVTDDDGAAVSDTLEVEVAAIEATINFDPDTLNKTGGGTWVTVYIDLPDGYDVKKIDATKVKLNDTIPAVVDPKYGWATSEDSYIMDHDTDGILERMVKFDSDLVEAALEIGDAITVTVTGKVEYDNGYSIALADFEGFDIIRVIEKGNDPDVAKDDGKDKDKKDKGAPAAQFEFAALAAYPQPCNPEVWIPYTLAEGVQVSVTIYNTSGRLIRTLDLAYQNAGAYVSKDKAAYWDGRNEHGEEISSGLYFYAIQAGDFFATRKLVILK